MKESPLEAEAAMLIKAAGLPEPGRQARFGNDVGRKWAADFAWNHMAGRIFLEIDGGGFGRGRHHRNSGREDDMVREAYCALRGIRLLRVTPNLMRRGIMVKWLHFALYGSPGADELRDGFPLGSALRPREAARRRLKARAKRTLRRAV